MNSQEIVDEIVEVLQEGVDPSDMTIYLSSDSCGKLFADSGVIAGNFFRNTKEDDDLKLLGVDVVPAKETEIVHDSYCDSCGSEKIFHDTRHKWLCPFCELNET